MRWLNLLQGIIKENNTKKSTKTIIFWAGFLKTINYRNLMRFIQLKVTSFIRRNTEVFLLILLLVVSTLIIQVYNFQNKKVDNEYIKILRNTYFKKTIKPIFFTFLPLILVPGRFKQLRETRRIHLHHSWYLSTPGISSYVHFCEQVNE